MAALKGRDLLSLADLNTLEVQEPSSGSAAQGRSATCGAIKFWGFCSTKPRTRVSFSVAMYQLGGQVIDLNPDVTQVSRGTSSGYAGFDRYLDILAIRTFEQQQLETFANYAEIPVINAFE